jgi:hypothetical protein
MHRRATLRVDEQRGTRGTRHAKALLRPSHTFRASDVFSSKKMGSRQSKGCCPSHDEWEIHAAATPPQLDTHAPVAQQKKNSITAATS